MIQQKFFEGEGFKFQDNETGKIFMGIPKDSSLQDKKKKVLFFVFWSFLLFLILNESFGVFRIAETFTFISAFSLSALHIYNLNYCQCADENCCVNDQ